MLRETAERAKATCPVSKALAGVEITLELPDLAAGRRGVAEGEELASVDADEGLTGATSGSGRRLGPAARTPLP